MKTISAQDFLGNQSPYRYVTGKLAGRPVVVFIQDAPIRTTSITNLIEVLATKAVAVEFPNTDPSSVRFFEFYPPELNPMIDWQEVMFQECSLMNEPCTLLEKLAQLFVGTKEQAWLLDKPQWHRPITAEEQRELQKLVGASH